MFVLNDNIYTYIFNELDSINLTILLLIESYFYVFHRYFQL